MYSLYRAWLSLGPCGGASMPPGAALPVLQGAMPTTSGTSLNLSANTQLPGAPDVALQVGPTMTHFSAHRAVLSAHSGFFKAALTNHTGLSPISVPNVNVDEFSSLLTFMYTGFLDLNIANIYNILLATHILHMPRALEICRTFLMQTQSLEPRPNIIKPIPSRKSVQPHQQIFAPTFSNLNKSEDTPFRAVVVDVDAHNEPSTSRCVNEQDNVKSTHDNQKRDKSKGKKRPERTNEKVVIDIACCDGPVRFHRVVNKNYGLNSPPDEYQHVRNVDRNDAMNKAMNENIRDKRLNDENGAGDVFTCLYCNHTFKSQYCYQKHARRHLNPVSLDAKGAQRVELKREFKLLDMNVQYYPCKTCGSKFPSYYFVHKHRKLCHAEEMADSGNKNNEMVAEKGCGNTEQTDSGSDTSKSSAIDVEGVNQ